MYKITISRSVEREGSVVLATQVAVLYKPEIPDDIDDIVDDYDGDFYEIEYPDEGDYDE